MYKFFLYFMLIVIYLVLAKALSPSEKGVEYLQSEKGFYKLVKGNFSTVILTDTHVTGFIIKTYYQKFRIISGYDNIEEVIIRTSKEFAKKNLPFIGLSIYRKINEKEEFLPVPPGSIYLNNSEFGEWRIGKDGKSRWIFKNAFRNFPQYLGWGEFRPDEQFYHQLKNSIIANKPFMGTNNEFGPEGKITIENNPHFFKDERSKKIELKTLLFDYLKENF